MSAILSPCGKYRYTLSRKLADTGPSKLALFFMLNPSTADAVHDDPTIRRCQSFAVREGCTQLTVVNLFALRSPNPEDLETSDNPVGPENDQHIAEQISLAQAQDGIIIAAWGSHKFARSRAEAVNAQFGPFQCLGTTKDGSPRHPLYIKADVPLMEFGR